MVAADEVPNFFAGPTITIDKTPPKVNSIVSSVAFIAGQYSTNAASVQYVVTFDEAVTGVAAQIGGVYSNLALTTSGLTGAAITGVSADAAGDVYTITINTGVVNRRGHDRFVAVGRQSGHDYGRSRQFAGRLHGPDRPLSSTGFSPRSRSQRPTAS